MLRRRRAKSCLRAHYGPDVVEDGVVQVLPVLPWTLGALGLVLLVGLAVPPRRAGAPSPLTAAGSPAAGRTGAVLLAGLLVLLAAGARLGPAGELDNPVPALVVGLAWPALLVLPAALARPGRDGPPDVRPAVLLALAVVGYLVVAVRPSRPATLAAALAAYGVLVAAVGLAGGRAAVGRTEVLGLLGRWASLGPRLARWTPPRGAGAVLAVVLAGGWAERLERTERWTAALPGRPAAVVLLAVCLAGAALGAVGLRPHHRAAVLLPLVAGAVLGGGLRRVLISAQVLLQQAGERDQVVPDPLGVDGGQAVALAAVVLGGCLAAAVLARRAGDGPDRLRDLGVVLAVTAVSAAAVLQP